MFIEDLVKVFESIIKDEHPELINSEFISDLSMAISNKKYDIQDQALIETILTEDRENFVDDFSDTLKNRLRNEKELSEFINSKEGQKEIIGLYIKSIEHMIDFYYNNIISKQFSST